MNLYVYTAFYRGCMVKVHAESSTQAKVIAAKKFKADQPHKVVTVLSKRSHKRQGDDEMEVIT